MTITEFLLARIEEDEQVARAADGPVWESGDGDVSEGGLYANHWVIAWFKLGETDPDHNFPRYSSWVRHAHENSVHAAHHDPARVLAECQAKRAIIEWHRNWPVLVEEPPIFAPPRGDINALTVAVSQQMQWMTQREYIAVFGTEPPPTPILRALAAVYKDHPDYNPDWGTQ